MNIVAELKSRGLINDMTDPKLAEMLDAESFTLYVGFDPTADSLHVGHLLSILVMVHFQRAGHRPIAVVGGATGMIGDPSGKNAERNLLDEAALSHNVNCIREQLGRFLDFDKASGAILENNHDWLSEFSMLDWLRDVGKHFSVSSMMGKESVKQRIGSDSGISYTEFSYQLLQSYDFYHLWEKHKCRLQCGGSDQWGNITAGIDFARRKGSPQMYGLTWPLVTKADGTKFGKSESGAVWLSPERTSDYEFYQYWIRQGDADVSRYLDYFTFLSTEERAELCKEIETAPEKRNAQKVLATELTRLVRGEDGLRRALAATKILFGGEISDIDDKELLAIFADVPSGEIQASALGEGVSLIDVMAETKMMKSKGEARRGIKAGGGYFNNDKNTDTEYKLTKDDLASESIIVLRSGKKRYHLVLCK